MIETSFAACLRPHGNHGVFLPGRARPVLEINKQYFQHDLHGKLVSVVVNNIADVKGDFYNIDAELLLSTQRINVAHLSLESSLPLLGMKIIEAYAKMVVSETSTWARERITTEEILLEFLKPEMAAPNNSELLEKMCDTLDTILRELKTDIRQFIGADDWVMHFVKMRGSDLYVEKTIDFRIYDWTRRTKGGEWL
jgi:hypothetical protein